MGEQKNWKTNLIKKTGKKKPIIILKKSTGLVSVL